MENKPARGWWSPDFYCVDPSPEAIHLHSLSRSVMMLFLISDVEGFVEKLSINGNIKKIEKEGLA